MIGARFAWRRTFDVGCTVDVAHTADSLHAHVVLDGAPDIRAGDQVIVHQAPRDVAYGEATVTRRVATIVRASWIERLWVRIAAYCELTALYEIGFSIGRQR
jgi:hypothetical protein